MLPPRFFQRALGALVAVAIAASPVAAAQTEILWDIWGVPHIYAPTAEESFRALGWAQMKSHGNLLLRLYAQGRGRAAEYLGEAYLASDQDVRLMNIPAEGERLVAAQSSQFRTYLDAFVAGINQYAERHPSEIDPALRPVLPVSSADIGRHIVGDLLSFLARTPAAPDCGALLPGLVSEPVTGTVFRPGSNGWAISPSRSASGQAMLLANPHLGWSGRTLTYEAQLVTPSIGLNLSGATLVGLPALTFGFDDQHAWTHTVNPIDACDTYKLTLLNGGRSYRFDGQARSFETRTEFIRVREADGSLRTIPYPIRSTVHGPVRKGSDGTPYAIRIVGVGEFLTPGVLEQWFDMGRARNLAEFEAALSRLEIAMFYTVYADRDGKTLLVYNGRLPVRSTGDWNFWAQPVAGDTSALVWNRFHTYAELPKLANPAAGWLQNANSAPWYMAEPPLDPAAYPPYFGPVFKLPREQRAVRMLSDDASISFEELVAYKYSNRAELSERVLDDLIAAAAASANPLTRRAGTVLAAWDRSFDAESRGALLFDTWISRWLSLSAVRNQANGNPPPPPAQIFDYLTGPGFFRVPFDPQDSQATPTGLADPELAARALTLAASDLGAAIDVPFGEIARLARGAYDFPGNGGSELAGTFRRIDFAAAENGLPGASVGGDSFVAVVEFGPTLRAQVLNTPGNATQPGSPHFGDQLQFAASKTLRPAWRTRAEVEANLEAREVLP